MCKRERAHLVQNWCSTYAQLALNRRKTVAQLALIWADFKKPFFVLKRAKKGKKEKKKERKKEKR